MQYFLFGSVAINIYLFIKMSLSSYLNLAMRFLLGMAIFGATMVGITYGYKDIPSTMNLQAVAIIYAYLATVCLLTIVMVDTPEWRPIRTIIQLIKLALTVLAFVFGSVALMKFGVIVA